MHKLSFFLRRFRILVAALATFGLAACGFKIQEPEDSSVVTPTPAATTKVAVTGKNYTLTRVTADGNDVTMVQPNSNTYEFDLNLTPGKHTIVAYGDVSCLFCSGGQDHVADTRTFCVVDPAGPPATEDTFTVFAKDDQMIWDTSLKGNAPGTLSLVSSASGFPEQDYQHFVLRVVQIAGAGGLGPIGTIRARYGYPCLCASSADGTEGSPIAMVFCDDNDTRQQWNGHPEGSESSGGNITKEFFSFTMGNSTITEETDSAQNKIVVQSSNTRPGQLWSLRNNTTNKFVTDTTPWQN